jgi:hypothetical protein
MVVHSNSGIVLSTDWEKKLEHWLETVPSCNQRKATGDIRRKAEQEANRMRLRKRQLSDAEGVLLLSLPCVVKGCEETEHEMEHFPPKRYLKDLDVETNRHFVWSICKEHNRVLSKFIRKMPIAHPIPPVSLELNPDVDPLRIYSASANIGIAKFYNSLRKEKDHPVTEEDMEVAYQTVISVIGLWKAINFLPPEMLSNVWRTETSRKIKGKNPHIPSRSQLPIHPSYSN